MLQRSSLERKEFKEDELKLIKKFDVKNLAVIFPENEASINLHKKCGFRVVGTHERMGKMDGIWRDNIVMERRSTNVGIN